MVLTQRPQRWWERTGVSRRVAEGVGAQRVSCLEGAEGAALAHGTEAFQPPPRAAYGNFFHGRAK